MRLNITKYTLIRTKELYHQEFNLEKITKSPVYFLNDCGSINKILYLNTNT